MRVLISSLALAVLIIYKWPKRKQEPVLNNRVCPVCKSIGVDITSEGLCEDCGNIIY